jgi:hypothetical protein
MKITMLIGFLFIMLVAFTGPWSVPFAHAGHRKPAVNYGAFCRGRGGEVHKHLSISDAIKAMREYFLRQGLEIVHITHDSRFVRADVVDKSGETIDSILLDSWTGRMRSVY